jgi:putative DNA primase/helicase
MRALAYYDENRKFVGRYPAVVAPIVGPDLTLQSAARIYTNTELKSRKKPMPPIATISGAAVRLFDADEELGIGEGIETCLAAHELFGVPVWAVLSAGGIKTFVPPPGLRRLMIFSDNDAGKTFAGQLAAFHLANQICARKGKRIDIEVHVPPVAGWDWNDALNEGWRP